MSDAKPSARCFWTPGLRCACVAAKASHVRLSWHGLAHSDSSPLPLWIEPVVASVLAFGGDVCEVSAMGEPGERSRSR
eukprot:953326-Alexandrium_andersonii.AAC.1